jgi:hypothetical protein
MSEEETKKRKRQRTPNNHTTTGFRISDELWAVLQPLLPVHVNTHRFGGGRPRVPDALSNPPGDRHSAVQIPGVFCCFPMAQTP